MPEEVRDRKSETCTYSCSDVADGDIWDIGSEQEDESISILDVSEDDYVVGSKTSFSQPTTVVCANLRLALSGVQKWKYIAGSKGLDQDTTELFTVHNPQTKEGEKNYAARLHEYRRIRMSTGQ